MSKSQAPGEFVFAPRHGAVVETVFAKSGRYVVVVYQRPDGRFSYYCFEWSLEDAEYLREGGHWATCDAGGIYDRADRARADALVALRACSGEPL